MVDKKIYGSFEAFMIYAPEDTVYNKIIYFVFYKWFEIIKAITMIRD